MKSKTYFQNHVSTPTFQIIVIRYNSVWRANQELVGIQNDAAHEELVEPTNKWDNN